MRLEHCDLRNVLRGRKPSEVRSCCRSEDRPHIDALDQPTVLLARRYASALADPAAHAERWPRTPSRSRRQAVRPDPPDAPWIS